VGDVMLAPGYSCRAMTANDIPELVQIERESFGLPWNQQMFLSELDYPYGWRHVALDLGGEVVGYLICRYYGDLWHIMDIATRRGDRRCGVAGHLFDEFLQQTAATAVPYVLEVRVSNADAIALYLSRGFRAVGARRGYYHDTAEDALVMELPAGGVPR
jgi:[ribosomal protein S18]-alanine N-acetyltransferase